MTSSEVAERQAEGSTLFERNVRRMRNEWAAEQARVEPGQARSAGPSGRPFVVPFFCECDSVHCHAVVWMTYEAYETLRAAPFLRIVSPGHDVTLPAAA